MKKRKVIITINYQKRVNPIRRSAAPLFIFSQGFVWQMAEKGGRWGKHFEEYRGIL